MYHDELIPVAKAKKIIEKIELKTKKECIKLSEANMRVLSRDIEVLIDVPPFDRAAMDGYAIIAKNTSHASRQDPVALKIIDDIGAGYTSNVNLKNGEAVKIATGAPMPAGSDAVIMQEFSYEKGEYVYLEKPVTFNQDVSLQGEDLKKGELILKKGQILNPHFMALIASAGHKTIEVYKKPQIGVIITGNELVEPSSELKPGMIINSNQYALKGLIEECKCGGEIFIVPDDLGRLSSTLEYCIHNFDVVITTGGTAISKGDLIVDLVEIKGEVLMHGVSMKPGKPFGFGLINDKPIFMLSGYPVAVAVQFDIFVREYLFKMQNIYWEMKARDAVALSDMKSSPDKYNVIRAFYNNGEVKGLRTRAGINKSILESNCYVISKEGKGQIKKGDTCQVVTYKSLQLCE